MAPPKNKELKPAEVAAVKKKAAARKPFFTLGGGFIKMNIVFPPIRAFVGTPDARIPAAASTLILQSRRILESQEPPSHSPFRAGLVTLTAH